MSRTADELGTPASHADRDISLPRVMLVRAITTSRLGPSTRTVTRNAFAQRSSAPSPDGVSRLRRSLALPPSPARR
jgi:hypothetical protein